MTEARQKIIDRIKALIARGKSTFEEEARTSLYTAHQLMEKHKVTWADLAGIVTVREPTEAEIEQKVEEEAVGRLRDHMRAIGHVGGINSGKARMLKISPTRRKAIAKKAAMARWGWKKHPR